MEGKLVPEAKPMMLCGDVLSDPETGNVHLVGCFNDIRPRASPSFPHRQPEFCVFLQLSDAQGTIPGFVQVIQADSQVLVYRTPSHAMLFRDRTSLTRVCFRLRNCTFS